jgi:hypothetical protein
VDSEKLASMYAEIVNGKSKDQSRFVTDDESSQLWDRVAAQVEQIRRDRPGAVFSIPNEVPNPPDGSQRAEPPDEAPAQPGGSQQGE